jgi:hypothetical protein
MVTSTEHRVRPTSTVESELDRTSWTKPATAPRTQNEDDKQTGSNFVYAILAFAVLGGGYLFYTYEWPAPSVTPAITKTDIAPSAIAPTPAVPSASTTVTPPAVAPVTPPAAGTVTPPATTTTP